MTGTPLDLTPFGGLLAALGWLYWLVALAILFVAWWLPRALWHKVVATMVVAGAVIYPVFVRPVQTKAQSEQELRAKYKAKLEAAMVLFNRRCETAGEKITRTVGNVDGVVWMKWREPYSNADNFADQFKLNDPYGRDCGAEECILNLLRVAKGAELYPEDAARHSKGYRFVESVDPSDGAAYRYVGVMLPSPSWKPEEIEKYKREKRRDTLPPYAYKFQTERHPVAKPTARYGITWDDISTHEDREHWTAGGSLKVIDLQTNEVIAERVGYMVDKGQGSQAGGRSPWLFAVQDACPEFPHEPTDSRRGRTLHETRDFVFKVLQLAEGE